MQLKMLYICVLKGAIIEIIRLEFQPSIKAKFWIYYVVFFEGISIVSGKY
jgi:hypothetical protein